MAKKKKNGSKETTLANILFATAILDLILKVLELVNRLLDHLTG